MYLGALSMARNNALKQVNRNLRGEENTTQVKSSFQQMKHPRQSSTKFSFEMDEQQNRSLGGKLITKQA